MRFSSFCVLTMLIAAYCCGCSPIEKERNNPFDPQSLTYPPLPSALLYLGAAHVLGEYWSVLFYELDFPKSLERDVPCQFKFYYSWRQEDFSETLSHGFNSYLYMLTGYLSNGMQGRLEYWYGGEMLKSCEWSLPPSSVPLVRSCRFVHYQPDPGNHVLEFELTFEKPLTRPFLADVRLEHWGKEKQYYSIVTAGDTVPLLTVDEDPFKYDEYAIEIYNWEQLLYSGTFTITSYAVEGGSHYIHSYPTDMEAPFLNIAGMRKRNTHSCQENKEWRSHVVPWLIIY